MESEEAIKSDGGRQRDRGPEVFNWECQSVSSQTQNGMSHRTDLFFLQSEGRDKEGKEW